MLSLRVIRVVLALAVGLLAGFGATTQAQAYHFAPASTTFTASGDQDIVFGGSHTNCHVRYTGYTNAVGGAALTSGVTSGSAPLLCSFVTFTGFPWTLSAIGPGSVQLANVGYLIPGVTCGPSTVTGTLSGAFLNFNAPVAPAGCFFAASLATSPSLFIVP